MSSTAPNSRHLTVLLTGGLLAPALLQAVNEVAQKYRLTAYLTTLQNLRLLGLNDDNIDEVKKELLDRGVPVKVPGLFPSPKVCVGMPYCNLAQADTFELAEAMAARYGKRAGLKPKLKIALSGCPANCGGALLADIGIVATRSGLDLYAGGKGGPLPRVGRRLAQGLSAEEILVAVGRLVDYHQEKTGKKQRLFKLLDEPDFPFPVE